MKVKAIVLSVSSIEVFPTNIKYKGEGEISLDLRLGKNEKISRVKLAFSPLALSYIFDIAEMFPSKIFEYNFSISILNNEGEKQEEANIRSLTAGNSYLLSGVAAKVIHDFCIVAKNINGSACLIFKRVTSQEKCSVCWDKDMNSSNNSNCKSCGGTGYKSEYSNPFKTYAGAIQDGASQTAHQQEGMISDYGAVMVSLPALILMHTDDILFYKLTGTWYIVESSISVSGVRTDDVLQTIGMQEPPSKSPQVESLLAKHRDEITNKGR